MIHKVILPHYFIIAFAVGMFYVYVTTPPPEIIEKFPSPYNTGSVKYTNKASNSCYYISATKKECPIDNNLIKQQPL